VLMEKIAGKPICLFLMERDLCHTRYGKAAIVYGSSSHMAALELVGVRAPRLRLATSNAA
jgi:hypothetical protein